MPTLYLVEQPQFPLISWIINNVASSVSPGEDDPALEPVSLLCRHSELQWSVVDINNHCWQQHHLNQSAPVTDILHHHHWLSHPVSSGIIELIAVLRMLVLINLINSVRIRCTDILHQAYF